MGRERVGGAIQVIGHKCDQTQNKLPITNSH